jgi:uncharacterized membrane protein (DUF4010 family)
VYSFVFQTDPIAASLDEPVVRLALAAALGLFLGLEREWSEKPAGIRTFSLTTLLGALFTQVASDPAVGNVLLVVGGVLVVAQGVLLAVQGLQREGGDALSLTTSVSLLVAYGVGVLVGEGFVLSAVAVAVISTTLLVLKRELHGFAGGLQREELRSTAEFAIIAFVVFPLLPAGSYDLPVLGVAVEPRLIWLIVVTVAGIGIVNYAIVQTYGGRGIAVTGFFGGLASSTAVVGSMLTYVRRGDDAIPYGVAAVLLADAAMALRNLVIALAFTVSGELLVGAVVPLGVLILGSVAVAGYTADWSETVDVELASPFSLRNALGFGGVFLAVVVAGKIAQSTFGTAGLYVTSLLSGLVSSAGATASAVLLYSRGDIAGTEAVVAVLLATAASVAVKAGLAAAGPSAFVRRVAGWSAVLLFASGLVTAGLALL